MAPLTWKHHALVQSLLSRGPLKEEEFHAVFFGVTGKNPATDQQLFNDFLLKINKELAYIQFELRACRNQYDGKVFYGVVNNVDDEQSKLGTKYSVPQIAFYKGVIEAIIQDIANQGCITNIEALYIRLENQIQAKQDTEDSQSRIPAGFRTFSISQKEKTLNDLIQDQWLCNTSDGKIGLGIRSFLDLRSWLRNNDIPPCDICNEAGVKASTCPNEDCPVRIHDYCLKKKFSQRKGGRVCPRCETEWPQPENEEDEESVPEQGEVASPDPVVRKRPRTVKAEAVESRQAQIVGNSDAVQRRKLRSCKAERVDATESVASTPTMPSDNRRTRRSGRV